MDALADEYAASCARARRRACAPLLAFLRAPGVQLHCDLSRCASPLADDGIARCAAVLARDASLRSLDVSHNAVGALGARELGRVLITQGLLHTLTIADNRLDCEALGELARALLRAATDAGASALTALDLSFNHIEAEGAASLAAALRARPRGGLRTLVLSGNRIGPVGAEALASALRADVSLQTLRLRACHIGDTGAAGLGAALLVNRALAELDLGANGISAAGLEALLGLRPASASASGLGLGSGEGSGLGPGFGPGLGLGPASAASRSEASNEEDDGLPTPGLLPPPGQGLALDRLFLRANVLLDSVFLFL
ncbi:hypothetical protein T492DRAFT_845269 [Pavlovales sp. CCMP2436]|nr:hypothetical protein T492DRAFT_845269 [Pavlovales sp. CCMP2436]